jgi:hypothetical protein
MIVERKIGSLVICFLAVFLLAGCSVNPSKVDKKYAEKYTDEMTYVKDKKTGICFAIVANRKTGSTDTASVTHSYVPCDMCRDQLVNP